MTGLNHKLAFGNILQGHSLCGRKFYSTSSGYLVTADHLVSCKRCLKKMAKIEKTAWTVMYRRPNETAWRDGAPMSKSQAETAAAQLRAIGREAEVKKR